MTETLKRSCLDCEYAEPYPGERDIRHCTIRPWSFSPTPNCAKKNCVKWLPKGSVRTEPKFTRFGYPDDPAWWHDETEKDSEEDGEECPYEQCTLEAWG